MSRITLYGFNQYDPTLFNDIELPEGLEKDILIDTILCESGDLYPYYQQPVYLKRNINNWFKRMYLNFQRMYEALTIEYSPIENYNRYEDYTDNRTQQSSDTSSSTSTGTREDKTSAFDSSGYSPASYTDSGNTANVQQSISGTENLIHSAHLHGNIGLTQNVDMIRAELELRTYDLYIEIARLFEERFIVQVY